MALWGYTEVKRDHMQGLCGKAFWGYTIKRDHMAVYKVVWELHRD